MEYFSRIYCRQLSMHNGFLQHRISSNALGVESPVFSLLGSYICLATWWSFKTWRISPYVMDTYILSMRGGREIKDGGGALFTHHEPFITVDEKAKRFTTTRQRNAIYGSEITIICGSPYLHDQCNTHILFIRAYAMLCFFYFVTVTELMLFK